MASSSSVLIISIITCQQSDGAGWPGYFYLTKSGLAWSKAAIASADKTATRQASERDT